MNFNFETIGNKLESARTFIEQLRTRTNLLRLLDFQVITLLK